MKLIAIIPARTNSKRLPNKNFKNFFGRPIIEWVIDEVKKSELFDAIVLSTDINIIRHDIYIHKRKNSTYEQTVDEICLEVLEKFPNYDYLCCVYPTAYAVTWQDLCKSFDLLFQGLLTKDDNPTKIECCFSVGMLNYQNRTNHDILYNIGEIKELNHPPSYQFIDNGGFYWSRIETFLNWANPKTLIHGNRQTYNLPMVDINTLQDFADAKLHAIGLPCGRYTNK